MYRSIPNRKPINFSDFNIYLIVNRYWKLIKTHTTHLLLQTPRHVKEFGADNKWKCWSRTANQWKPHHQPRNRNFALRQVFFLSLSYSLAPLFLWITPSLSLATRLTETYNGPFVLEGFMSSTHDTTQHLIPPINGLGDQLTVRDNEYQSPNGLTSLHGPHFPTPVRGNPNLWDRCGKPAPISRFFLGNMTLGL